MPDEQGSQSGSGGGGAASPQVIVIKKKNRGGGHGHHGGAWKVAYADFVTAMMAFFLLLWLLATTTEEQKAGIAHYFNPPNNSTQNGGGTGIMGGDSVIPVELHAATAVADMPPTPTSSSEDVAVQAQEDAMFRQVAEEMKKAVMNIPQLKALLDNMLIDVTPEGLRISITDREGRELFVDGQAQMQPYTQQLLGVVGSVLSKLPNKLALGAHTDVAPYRRLPDVIVPDTYTNWELTTDRAQAMRRVLESEGLTDKRFQRVAGFAGSELMLPDQPTHVKNRRLTVIVLRSKKGTVAQFNQDGLLAPSPHGEVLP
jgi:chemotaxis protein MotB